MAYEMRAAAINAGPGDKKKKKKRVSGYKEKSGEIHKTKEGFYKSKADKEKTDRKVFKTADGKIHSTMAEYNAHKAKLRKSGEYYK